MSTVASPAAPPAGEQASHAGDTSAQQRKSYRRKYRKIMVKFEERMRESTGLFKDEQRIFDISQRLAEQTDQMLQLLVEFNSRPQIPSRLRFDLTPASQTKNSQNPERHIHEETVHETLRDERNRIQKGEATPLDYERIQKDVLDTVEFAPTKSYTSIVRKVSLMNINPQPSNISTTPAVGALTIRQEEQYLQSLDDYLDGKSSVTRAHASKNLGSRTAEKTTDREREMQLKNPVSVYNWLRKHQPQVFLQDHESASTDKASKSSASRTSKRTVGKEIKQEQDYYDEDGIAMEHSSSKGKRKREEDPAFRPKGGRSSHPSKRKKEESNGKRSKRSSMDARS